MQILKVITKCCICGRERDEMLGIWRHRPGPADPGARYSHGFCSMCYETEIMKLKLRNLEYAEQPAAACPV